MIYLKLKYYRQKLIGTHDFSKKIMFSVMDSHLRNNAVIAAAFNRFKDSIENLISL